MLSALKSIQAIAVAAAIIGVATADLTEQNATICNWAQARAGVIRDAVYVDGGEMWWKVGFADGNTNLVTNNGNEAGLIYYLNYSQPFDVTRTNLTALFQSKEKAGGAANNIAPNYIDGTMFANNDELYLYGGLLRLTDAYSAPADNAVLGYEAYQYGPERQLWSPGFIESTTTAGVTRYVTNGAGVNVPSENLGFYFSGMRAADWGPIYIDNDSANVSANTLIEINMTTMRAEVWTNHTLPDSITPRANAQLAWIPVSDQGVLVAIGGVAVPEEIFAGGLNSSQTAESKAESPTFMTSIPVYDIASSTWYLQNTTGDAPPQLTEFCSVVASASDGSSHNVYIYGGYDGLDAIDPPSDDVWVLSIPSFTWIKVYSGSASHARSGHVCTMPYPDQMFVIGGLHQDPTQCVDGIIQVFNLNTLTFQDVYNPTIWSNYSVPTAISSVIGGSTNGGATKSASFSDGSLKTLFSARYSKSITNYYPYPYDDVTAIAPGTTTTSSSSSFPLWAIVVLAVVVGFLLICLLLFLFVCLRRRKLIRRHESVLSSNSSNRIMRWANGMPFHSDPKDDSQEPKTVSSVYSTDGEAAACECPPGTISEPAEASGSERFELHSETAPPRPPIEMATPYNSQDNRIFAGTGAGVGIARGSSAYSEPAHGPESESLTISKSDSNSDDVPPTRRAGARNASWISSMGPTMVGGHSASSSGDESNNNSKRMSGFSPLTPTNPRRSYAQNHAWGEHWPLLISAAREVEVGVQYVYAWSETDPAARCFNPGVEGAVCRLLTALTKRQSSETAVIVRHRSQFLQACQVSTSEVGHSQGREFGLAGRTAEPADWCSTRPYLEATLPRLWVRNISSLEPRKGLVIVEGTPTKIDDVEKAFAASSPTIPDAAIVTLNSVRESDSPFAKQLSPARLMADSSKNVIAVLKQHGVRRIVTMSTVGVGDSWATMPLMTRLFMGHSNIKYAVDDHNLVDQEMRESGMDFTLVRPTRLVYDEVVKPVRTLGSDAKGMGITASTTTGTVARFLVDAVDSGKWARKAIAVSN